MQRAFYKVLDVVDDDTGAGVQVDVSSVEGMRLQVTGTFTATLKVEESVDGVGWTQVGSDVTAAGIVDLSALETRYLRINTSAYTDGTPAAALFGVEVMPNGLPKRSARTMSVATSVAAGTAIDISDLADGAKVGISGTFTATMKVEESVDGSTWVQVGSDVTAAALRTVTKRTRFLRINTSAYTSGTPAARLFGKPDVGAR